ncbi:MAG: aminotransferase class V-fold PLP-dependent enzyme [Oscillospiraceae bacterium]|nr:aminotransferase class V-fold PLP-dependent enzyme [Oscillospiraceae bacterium]
MIYLDNAATSYQKPRSVRAAVLSAMRECASPGRGGYRAAMTAAERVYRCREAAGELFDCAPERVVFTMNATHALNIAVKSLVPPGGRAVISGFEHNAVVRPLRALGANAVIAGRKLFDPADTLRAFSREITPDTDAVICTHVSNVFGYILPVAQIAALCRERGVPFVLDASQSVGVLPVSLRDLGAAFIAMPGHKGLYGPQGTGLLLCGAMPKPLLQGGTGSLSRQAEMPDFLPDRAEAGTQNVAGICGLDAGIRFVKSRGLPAIRDHETALCRLMARILERGGFRVFTGVNQSGVLSVCPPCDCELFAEKLAQRGVAVRAGLHCAPLAHESAGTADCGTVRFSPSAFTTAGEADAAARIALQCAEKIRKEAEKLPVSACEFAGYKL